tara:strand:+ start:541 stop:882 length:342 start_codon:yes stop_codon:yes gene_type:complete
MWTKDDVILWVCILGFSCVSFFAGLAAGTQAATKQLREQAVEEGVGFWSVDIVGNTEFVFSKRELPLVWKDKPQTGSFNFFLEEEEEEQDMMMFYRVDNQGVCNGEGCEEIHP